MIAKLQWNFDNITSIKVQPIEESKRTISSDNKLILSKNDALFANTKFTVE